MQLWLVRHAQPLVEPGVCYGAMDVPADPQATALAAAELAATLPARTLIQHSPLQRCELLAQHLIGLRPDLTLKPLADLREMDFGAWEGQRWDDIARVELQDWTDDFANYRCGGTGESTMLLMQRVASLLQGCLQRSASLFPDSPTVWITHAGVMRAADWLHQRGLATLDESPLCLRAGEWPQRALGFGQVQKLDWPDLVQLGLTPCPWG
jgi:alpha-ribazole phosphatase